MTLTLQRLHFKSKKMPSRRTVAIVWMSKMINHIYHIKTIKADFALILKKCEICEIFLLNNINNGKTVFCEVL